MPDVMSTEDRWRRTIVLTGENWTEKILLDHAELVGNEESVRIALVDPDWVGFDRDHADREVFYRRGALPPPDDQDYLKVCVAFRTAIDRWQHNGADRHRLRHRYHQTGGKNQVDEAAPTEQVATPELRVEDIDLSGVVVSYDRESDTLMLHLRGRGQPGISVLADDDLYVRLDRDRKQILGFQIEGFLARVARERPELLDALDVAELRGISFEEVARLRREIGAVQRKQAAVGEVIRHFPRFARVPEAS